MNFAKFLRILFLTENLRWLLLLAGDFNAQEEERLLDTFLYQHEVHSINKNSTCYENPNNPSNIDLILTIISQEVFLKQTQFSRVYLIFTNYLFKTTFTKSKPKEIIHKNYRKFNENNSNQDLENQLSSEQLKDYASFEKIVLSIFRSSRLEVFCKKGVLRNFAKFTEKHLCQSLFFNKIAGTACNFIKKETLPQVFSREFCEISKNTFYTEHLRWLLWNFRRTSEEKVTSYTQTIHRMLQSRLGKLL